MIGTSFGKLILAASVTVATDNPIRFEPDRPVSMTLAPTQRVDAILTLRAGESADLAVLQEGIDVVVEAHAPDGTLLESVDSPNGRQGDEPLSLFATVDGTYRIHVQPISANEPEGRITFRIVASRNATQTRRLLADRRRARLEAASWLRSWNAALPSGRVPANTEPLRPLDELAQGAQVIGLGEATHGSRELNDFRLAVVQRLVTRNGFRLVALEDSASRWRALEPYVQGEAANPVGTLEWGWIGRRVRRELLDWARQWNLEHPNDRIRIIGVDPQDNLASREQLGAFLEQAYGSGLAAQWRVRLAELAAADEQTAIFGDSGTSQELRQFVMEIAAQLAGDGPLLRRRFGDRAYEDARSAAGDLAAFTDFNTGSGAIGHSRDWYMALAILRAIDQGRTRPKAIFWAHNSHVSAAETRWGPTGALLRQAFGCGYRALASTFGAGAFVTQLAGDPDNRLIIGQVRAPADETAEGVLTLVRPGAHLTVWGCGDTVNQAPAWLQADRPLRWIGGIYSPTTLPSGNYRPYRLTVAFDAIAFIPEVVAETIPPDLPRIPARQR